MEELRKKTEAMLHGIFDHMRSSHLLVNSDKTKVMLMATYQKRTNNDLKFHVELEGEEIKEVESARLLGVEIQNNFCWNKHVDETGNECSKRMNGLYEISRSISKEQKKVLVEGSIISRLRYAIEVVSSGSETVMNKLSSIQSRAARYILEKSRREWSKTEGFLELNWLTMPQIAVEASLRLFFRVLWKKKPEKLLGSIYCREKEEIVHLSPRDIEKMTKLNRKSWRTRVLRYNQKIPFFLHTLDPDSHGFKSSLKEWIREFVPQNGDSIFKGKVIPEATDWLLLELEEWQQKLKHEKESIKQQNDLEI